MTDAERPIGIFDSGIGGLSVLLHIRQLLPRENLLYLCDSEYAPYGNKSAELIIERADANIKRLISLGSKLIVIACNTATAVAVEEMRRKYISTGIVGLEPALRPAAEKYRPSEILVLATPLTLSQARFNRLKGEFESADERFVCIGAQETVRYVENWNLGTWEHISYLKGIFRPYADLRFRGCVLGCTHFPFAKHDICTALGYSPELFDGGAGSAKRTEVFLKREGILNNSKCDGKVIFMDKYCEKRYLSLISEQK